MRSSGCHTVAANRPPGLSTRQNSRSAAVWLGMNLCFGEAPKSSWRAVPSGYFRGFGGWQYVIKPRACLAPWPVSRRTAAVHSACAQLLPSPVHHPATHMRPSEQVTASKLASA